MKQSTATYLDPFSSRDEKGSRYVAELDSRSNPKLNESMNSQMHYILEYPFTTQSHYGAALVDPLEFPTFLSINTSFVSKAIISGMGLPF